MTGVESPLRVASPPPQQGVHKRGSSFYNIERRVIDGKEQPCKLVKHLLFCYDEHAIPPGFDVTKSTKANYGVNDKHFYGPYADIRASLDFEYHGNYNRKRQQFQDTLIRNVVGAAVEKEGPWIVFTAGAMGAGKSHVINWISQRGYFPLPDIVQIDPDLFKCGFPEWEEYVAYDPLQAGSKTRRESGYLVEIAQEAAMRMNKNVWVDGSLRDAEWYERVFSRIREFHPHYSIAILYVYASRETVFSRARRRGEETGRHVPKAEILDSLERAPKAVRRLRDRADFVASIRNEAAEPELTDFSDGDGHHLNAEGWAQVSQRFATTLHQADPSAHREHLMRLLAQPGITLFSKTYCSYSHKVKGVLMALGVQFSVVELDRGVHGVSLQHELSKVTGTHTTPQLFVDGRYVGTCDDVLKLKKHGRLRAALGLEPDKGGGGQEGGGALRSGSTSSPSSSSRSSMDAAEAEFAPCEAAVGAEQALASVVTASCL
eukprot:TRINITY_DN4342_c0_g1_i1.p1 TRINITY_DN4342_c0_g1~~TRINITY_DN4342_c0_g1_i1.p1  ORF type:complete len:489 (-),score=203.41 TRINITY_DN4342_c0_g1_i1:723-2189(-)